MIWDRTNRPLWLRCAVGVLVAVVAAAIRLHFLGILESRVTFVTFFPAVAIAALYGGFVPGFLATVVSAACADYFLLEPIGSFAIANIADTIGLIVFFASGTLISYLAEMTYRAQARAHKAEELSKLAAEREKAAVDLQQSESKYRELVQNANSAIIRWKRDGTIAFFNEYAQKFFGYSVEEVIGKNVNILVPEQESTGGDLTELVRDILNHPERFVNNINENVLRDGSRVWMAWTNRPVFDQDGQVVEILCVGSDITERKRTEQALLESEERFKVLAQASFEGIGFSDGGVVIDANTQLAQMLGYDLSETIGKPVADMIAPEDRELVRQYMEAGYEGRYENRLLRKDGSTLVVETQAKHFAYRGRIVRVTAMRDITERKQAEEMLREAQSEAQRYGAEMGTLMDAVPAAVFVAHDVECHHMSGSLFTQELLGLPGTSNFSKSAPPLERPTHFRAMKDGVEIPPDELPVQMAANGREIRDYEFELLFDDGESRHLLGNATPLRNAEGNVYGSVGAFVDITERKRAEEGLKKSKEEAERRSRELEALMDAVPALIWITRDAECLSMTGNRAVYEFLGMPSGANVSKTASEAARPVHFKALKDGVEIPLDELPMQQAAKGKGVQDYELEYVFDDGTSKITLGNTTPLYDVTGQAYGAIAAFVDITERKRAEEALRQSEQRLALATSATGIGIFDSNSLTNDIAGTEQFGYLVGLEETAATTTTSLSHHYHKDQWAKRVHPDDWLGLRAKIEESQSQRRPLDAEYRVTDADGTERWVNVRGVFQDDDQGNFLGVIIDITERKQAEEALRDSEAKLSTILENLTEGAVVSDMDGRLVYWNHAALEMHGFSEMDECLRPLSELFPRFHFWDMQGNNIEFDQLPLSRIIRGEKLINWELRAERTDLEWERIFSYCGNLAYDAQGNPLMAVVTIDDITERKQAEEALRASDERFRISKQAAMLGIHDYDVSSGKIQWDEKVRELWAVGPDLPITYEVFKSGVHPDDLKEVQRALDRALDPNGNAKYYCEYRVTGIGDGIQRWVAATGQVFFDQGRAVRLVGTVQEITERKQSETRLAADLAALTRMHELSGRLLEIGGIQSLLQEIMDAAVSVVGAEKGTLQLLESDSLRIVAAHGHKQPFLDFFASAESQASVCGEATRRGERVIVSDVETSSLFIGTPSLAILRGAGVRAVQSTPMMSRTGELLGILTTQWGVPYTPDEHDLWRIDLLVRQAADLIEHSRAEEELRKSRDELELRVQERTAELKSYMAKLEQSNQALQDFASIASHDMKEPLRKVISFGNMLRQKSGKSLGETGNDYLNRMLNATERMQSLLAGLLDYSRVATASEPLKEVDLSDLISEVLSDLEVRIVRTGGEVHVGRLPVISADPTQMRQLFQNLIGNALKFHKPGEKPKVQVRSVSNTDEGCQIIVEDAGIGFEEQYLERIFAPFQRLHGRSSQYEGTGMGLAICKKIVERHGGSIAARSTPGEGATFIIEIPVKYTNRTES